jgi:putative hemolysin
MTKETRCLIACTIILTIAIAGCAKDDETGLPNPASVYCEEQGGIVDLREGEGGVSGFCMFDDGSECEEWAFFNGECAPGDSIEEIGMPNPASVYCEEQGGTLEMRETDAGTAGFCIFDDGSECDEWEFFNGECKAGDYFGGGPGSDTPPPEEIADWWGIIGGTEVGDQFDDYFERQDLGQIIYFGIESQDPAIAAQIVDLRDSGKIVHLWGTVYSNVLDYNGSQILVTRIEVDEPVVDPADGVEVFALYGKVVGLDPGLQFDDYLQLAPDGSPGIGLEGITPEIEAQIVALRDKEPPGQYAHFWGTLLCPAIDFGECQLRVSRLRIDGPGEFFEPDVVEDWAGTIHTGITEPGSGGDDYFLLAAPIPIQYGIVSVIGVSGERDLEPELVALRDSGTPVRIWGTLMAGIPDWNGTQIEITRIELVGN